MGWSGCEVGGEKGVVIVLESVAGVKMDVGVCVGESVGVGGGVGSCGAWGCTVLGGGK